MLLNDPAPPKPPLVIIARMAKGGSSSQSSTMVPRGGRSATGAPTGSAGLLRRRPVRSGAGSGKLSQNVVNFYTDDSPGLKISPVVVIVMSLGFIGFVTLLHIVGKIRGV